MKSKKEAQGAFAESREVLEARGGQQQHAGQARGIVSTLMGAPDEKQLLFTQWGRGSLPRGGGEGGQAPVGPRQLGGPSLASTGGAWLAGM